ncbi:hypothetical protein XA68_18043 [Ophiocordyceps unilateralis]|uniref:Uncharacterized protein n=1 Tax=Ophiocordyceps unilateralis TaxID=268505 RepID=A0A2A9PJV4_OPHUN|nr:hypothetical protein XA68_18043 [Ophiocordyceps unilateralis]
MYQSRCVVTYLHLSWLRFLASPLYQHQLVIDPPSCHALRVEVALFTGVAIAATAISEDVTRRRVVVPSLDGHAILTDTDMFRLFDITYLGTSDSAKVYALRMQINSWSLSLRPTTLRTKDNVSQTSPFPPPRNRFSSLDISIMQWLLLLHFAFASQARKELRREDFDPHKPLSQDLHEYFPCQFGVQGWRMECVKNFLDIYRNIYLELSPVGIRTVRSRDNDIETMTQLRSLWCNREEPICRSNSTAMSSFTRSPLYLRCGYYASPGWWITENTRYIEKADAYGLWHEKTDGEIARWNLSARYCLASLEP